MAKKFDWEDEETDDSGGGGNLLGAGDVGDEIKSSLAKIPYQTSRHLCGNTGLDIADVLDWLNLNGDEVYGEQVGNFWVYYLKKNRPKNYLKKLYFGGADGRTIMLREDEDRGNTGNLRIGQKIVLNLPKPLFDEKRNYSNNSNKIEAGHLQELAEFNPDLSYIAGELDVHINRLRIDLREQENLNRAYEKGRKIYMENNKMTKNETTKKPAEQPDKSSASAAATSSKNDLSLRKRLTPAVIEEAAANGVSTAMLAKQFGLDAVRGGKQIDAILYSPKNADLKAAWKRGKAMRVKNPPQANKKNVENTVGPKPSETLPNDETDRNSALDTDLQEKQEVQGDSIAKANELMVDPRFKDTLEHISKNGHSREKLDLVKQKLTTGGFDFDFPNAVIIGRPHRNSNSVGISFAGNFFSLPKEKRDILSQMADLKDAFEQ